MARQVRPDADDLSQAVVGLSFVDKDVETCLGKARPCVGGKLRYHAVIAAADKHVGQHRLERAAFGNRRKMRLTSGLRDFDQVRRAQSP